MQRSPHLHCGTDDGFDAYVAALADPGVDAAKMPEL
jgi:hypothetical protein